MSTLTTLAEALARYVHRDQVDRQGAPYVGHLERVARSTNAWSGTSDAMLAAAWLHDAIEDGRLSWLAANDLFPAEVVSLLDILTRRRDERYERYIARVSGCLGATVIKLADLRDNLDSARGPIPASLRRRYQRALARLEGGAWLVGG